MAEQKSKICMIENIKFVWLKMRNLIDWNCKIHRLSTYSGLLGNLETLGFLFETLCERDLCIYAESLRAGLYHYQDYKNREIDAVIELPDKQWCAFPVLTTCLLTNVILLFI